TCSSDKTIKIFEVEGETHRLIETLKGYAGPCYLTDMRGRADMLTLPAPSQPRRASVAHPKFGTILASSSYDGKVLIWREQPATATSAPASLATSAAVGSGAAAGAAAGTWTRVFDFSMHTASVNMVSWAPHEAGCLLAAASSDGNLSVLEFSNNSWTHQTFRAHGMGVNSVSWAPSTAVGALLSTAPSATGAARRFVTGGSDNMVKIWEYNAESKEHTIATTLEGHTDWVRDVAWSPSVLIKSYIASASQDNTVRIWTSDPSSANPGEWTCQTLQFNCVMWRVSWSTSGNVLAVSGGDNHVSLWKEDLKGHWEKVKDIEE
ncbi:GTPase-activating protein S13, partial [Ascosphaera acerosa]